MHGCLQNVAGSPRCTGSPPSGRLKNSALCWFDSPLCFSRAPSDFRRLGLQARSGVETAEAAVAAPAAVAAAAAEAATETAVLAEPSKQGRQNSHNKGSSSSNKHVGKSEKTGKSSSGVDREEMSSATQPRPRGSSRRLLPRQPRQEAAGFMFHPHKLWIREVNVI